MHFHMNRGGGPRGDGGGRSRGRFGVDWSTGSWRDDMREQLRDAMGVGRGEPGRGRRMFDGGELRLVLLQLLAETPRHGYDLIREIEELTGGRYRPSPGVVYPTLTLLGEMGFTAEQDADGAKKRFGVTAEGQAHLDANRAQVDALIARLRQMGEHGARHDRGPVRRAMGNLGQAIANRVGRGELSDETLHAIAALLDETAQKIERLR